jgi:hypothetical protein
MKQHLVRLHVSMSQKKCSICGALGHAKAHCWSHRQFYNSARAMGEAPLRSIRHAAGMVRNEAMLERHISKLNGRLEAAIQADNEQENFGFAPVAEQ